MVPPGIKEVKRDALLTFARFEADVSQEPALPWRVAAGDQPWGQPFINEIFEKKNGSDVTDWSTGL